MSGTFTSVAVYVAAEIIGGIAAAVLYTHVVAASAPTTDDVDPQGAPPRPATAPWPPAGTPAPPRNPPKKPWPDPQD